MKTENDYNFCVATFSNYFKLNDFGERKIAVHGYQDEFLSIDSSDFNYIMKNSK